MSRGRRRNTPEGSRAGFSAKSHVCYDSAMNYRRGFQRLYAVFTLAWVVVLLFALPADRLKFWRIGGWDVRIADARASGSAGPLAIWNGYASAAAFHAAAP